MIYEQVLYDKQKEIYIDKNGMINTTHDNFSKNTKNKTIMIKERLTPVQYLKPYYKFFIPEKYPEILQKIKQNVSYFAEDETDLYNNFKGKNESTPVRLNFDNEIENQNKFKDREIFKKMLENGTKVGYDANADKIDLKWN